VTSIQNIERGAKLYSRPIDASPCRFQTCYDVQLVPVELLSAALESAAPAVELLSAGSPILGAFR
nr:type VI secretion system baseplate subunit TssF [Pyrinomonadaceae bacterium]